MNSAETTYVVIFIIAWAIIGAIFTPIAFAKRGRSAALGFFVGMIMGALGGIIFLAPLWIFLQAKKKTCPACAEKIQEDAIVCKHCGYHYDAKQVGYERSLAKAQQKRLNIRIVQGMLVLFAIGAMIFAYLTIVPLFSLWQREAEATRATQVALEAQGYVTSNEDWQVIERSLNGIAIVQVPPGCFRFGPEPEELRLETCVETSFWIDKTEVTTADFLRLGGTKYLVEFMQSTLYPVVSISLHEARQFCQLRGMQVPTEVEWEYAARGPSGLMFPWGNSFSETNTSYASNSNGQVASVGSYPNGVSWVGAVDMSGNVWEWVDTNYNENLYFIQQRNTAWTSDRGTVRGGSFRIDDIYFLRTTSRNWVFAPQSGDDLGFRCVYYGTP